MKSVPDPCRSLCFYNLASLLPLLLLPPLGPAAGTAAAALLLKLVGLVLVACCALFAN